jgi:hypothetical protein
LLRRRRRTLGRLRGCHAARGRWGAPAALPGRSVCDGANSFAMRTSLASLGTLAMLKPVFNTKAFMGSLARNISAVRRRAPRFLARHSISAVSSVPIPLPRQSPATESAMPHPRRSPPPAPGRIFGRDASHARVPPGAAPAARRRTDCNGTRARARARRPAGPRNRAGKVKHSPAGKRSARAKSRWVRAMALTRHAAADLAQRRCPAAR